MLDGKRVIVTGGTGSLGQVLVRRLLEGEMGVPEEVVVFSRSEALQHTMRLAFQHRRVATDDIVYDDTYNGLVVDDAEGDRLASVLGTKRVMFLANHGVIVVGPSVAEAFDSLYYLERACRLQVLARMMGGRMRAVRPEVVRSACRMMRDDAPKYAGAHFSALKRLLDREEPEYSR